MQLTKEVKNYISTNLYYNELDFKSDAKRYIKAIETGRMMVIIHSVSNSGMSRTMSFHEFEKNKTTKNYSYLQFCSFFSALGYKFTKNRDYFRVNGGGMDMVFATNYNVIRALYSMKIITKKQCEKLEQKTPISFF